MTTQEPSFTITQIRDRLDGWRVFDGDGTEVRPMPLHSILALLGDEQDGIAAVAQRHEERMAQAMRDWPDVEGRRVSTCVQCGHMFRGSQYQKGCRMCAERWVRGSGGGAITQPAVQS